MIWFFPKNFYITSGVLNRFSFSSAFTHSVPHYHKDGVDEVERAKNRSKSRVRSKVEHVFAVMKLSAVVHSCHDPILPYAMKQ